jgi:hypothetical protein
VLLRRRQCALLRRAASSAPLAAAMPRRQRAIGGEAEGRAVPVGQGTYNAITRDMEREIMPAMREFGMRAVMYNPLAVRSHALCRNDGVPWCDLVNCRHRPSMRRYPFGALWRAPAEQRSAA